MNRREFFAKVEPTAKSRPRLGRHGVYTPTKTSLYEFAILASYRHQCIGELTINKPLEISITFFMPIAKSISNVKRDNLISKPHTIRPDVDNLAKAVLDALNGVAYVDDSLIYKITCEKRYSENVGVNVVMDWND